MPNSTTLPPNGRRDGSEAGPVRKAWLLPLILGGIALALALAARFLWIEPSTMGLACAPVPPPWWCGPRTGVILVHQFNGWGLVALVSGLLALFFRWYPMALLGLASGLIGLVLYNAGLAAVGLLAALLLIIRR
jgi:hypothetical protein